VNAIRPSLYSRNLIPVHGLEVSPLRLDIILRRSLPPTYYYIRGARVQSIPTLNLNKFPIPEPYTTPTPLSRHHKHVGFLKQHLASSANAAVPPPRPPGRTAPHDLRAHTQYIPFSPLLPSLYITNPPPVTTVSFNCLPKWSIVTRTVDYCMLAMCRQVNEEATPYLQRLFQSMQLMAEAKGMDRELYGDVWTNNIMQGLDE
jgi:hypothetical protein